MLAYGGRDDKLFRAAILESGGPLGEWPYAIADADEYHEGLYTNLTTNTGCYSTTSPLECLRALPFAQLNAALNITDNWISDSGLGPWVPVVDGDFLQDYCSTQIAEGRFVKVPILIGTNTDEGTAAAPGRISSNEDFRAAVAQGGPDDETVAIVEYLYPDIPEIGIPLGYTLTDDDKATYGAQWKRAAAFFGDAVLQYPRRATCTAWAQNDVSAYSYRFNVQPAGVPGVIGVTHYQEIAWVFDNIDGAGWATNPFNVSDVDREAYIEVATLMTRMWASFVHHLNPNEHGLTGYPTWPKYDATEQGVGDNFVFDAKMTSYVERDDWRVPGIAFLTEKAKPQWKH